MNTKLTARRKVAMEQLQKQLVLGTKPNKGDGVLGTTITQHKKDFPRIPLTQKDIERIKNEINKLKAII